MKQLNVWAAGVAALLFAQSALADCDTHVTPIAVQEASQIDLMSGALALLKAEQRRALPRLWQSAQREQRSQLTAEWLNQQPSGGPNITAKARP